MIRVAIFGFILAACEILFIYSLNEDTSKATFELFSGEEHGSVTSLFHKSFHHCSMDEDCNYVARNKETNAYKKYSTEASLPKNKKKFVIFKRKIVIDECYEQPCQNNAACLDTVNSRYICQCLPGYTGTNCENDIDECAENPCLNNGTCTQGINRFTCKCTSKYIGTTCQVFNSCLSNPCKNDGTCNNFMTSQGKPYFTCTCTANYEGPLCSNQLCNRLLSAPTGEIISQNYPANYPLRLFYCWIIAAAPESRIKVVFHDFLLEKRYGGCIADYVHLLNGKMPTAPSIGGKFCASDQPGTRISSGNIMRIEFKSDGVLTYRGFNLTWNTIT